MIVNFYRTTRRDILDDSNRQSRRFCEYQIQTSVPSLWLDVTQNILVKDNFKPQIIESFFLFEWGYFSENNIVDKIGVYKCETECTVYFFFLRELFLLNSLDIPSLSVIE
jgi:hypothetical protein